MFEKPTPVLDPTLTAPAHGERAYDIRNVGQVALEPAEVAVGPSVETSSYSAILEHMSPEVNARVEAHSEAKQHARGEQQAKVYRLKEALTNGLMGRWLEKGTMKARPLIKDELELEKSIQKAVEVYRKTEAGQYDARIKALRDFLTKPKLSKDDLTKAGLLVGSNIGGRKLKFVPGYAAKVETTLRWHVEQELNGLVLSGGSGLDDKRSWEDVRTEEARDGWPIIDRVQRDAAFGYQDTLVKFRRAYGNVHNAHLSAGVRPDKLQSDIATVDKVHSEGVDELKRGVTNSDALLALIARGSLSVSDVVTRLKEHDHYGSASLHGMFEGYVTTQWIESANRLAEPSLAGMRITEQDVNAEVQCLQEIAELAVLCGVRTPHTVDQAKDQMREDIQRTQELFHSRIESPNSLYWHFSRRGFGIIASGKLQSASEELSNTGEWSQGVHFVKPGSGIDTRSQYPNYAKGTRTNTSQPIPDAALGVAVIYRLEDIIKHTPYRDEPLTDTYAGTDTSEDTTFRDKNQGSKYEYPLDDAYILPLMDWWQLSDLREQGRYHDIIASDKPIAQMAYEITARALRNAGHSDEWIKAHLLSSEELDSEMLIQSVARPGSEARLYSAVTHRINSLAKETNDSVVVPVTAKKGAFEHHDALDGVAPELWKEELIHINLAR